MYLIAEAAHPITGRGVGYKLFTSKLIQSMGRSDMQRVYRLLKEAREQDIIPWHWIVDEAREYECVPSWDDPEEFAGSVSRQYRRNFWSQQPTRCEVWSEKGTLRGVLAPVLDKYGVGFRVMHGFSSSTVVHDIAEDYDGRELVALYVGDWDPSGLYMSECDLPERLEKYDGDHVEVERVALTEDQLNGLPSFAARDKHASTSFEQDRLGPSPSKPYRRPPASASYDPVSGRAARVGQATPDSWRQIPSAGEHTAPNNAKRSTRPGRW
jgi:hypothetical protein